MRYRPSDDADTPGQDSFLDIVANIVGILIILVTVVGVRAAHAPLLEIETPDDTAQKEDPPAEELQKTTVDGETAATDAASWAEQEEALDEKRTEVAAFQAEVAKLATRVISAEQEAELRDVERVRLQAIVTALEEELANQRQALGDEERERFELRQKIDGALSRLEEIAREQFAVEIDSENVETIESLPTPLAKTVLGDEIHVRLRHGRVAVIPLDALLKLFEQDATAKLWMLNNRDGIVETVGPIGGFRLRYRLARQAYVAASGGSLRQGTLIQLDRWELLPVDERLGVPVVQALMPNSELHAALSGKPPEHTTVTVWTYPDSYAEFRALKKELFELGYSTAGRPLPSGIRIGGSPRGTKSSAQ